jgi:hypothetical protein
MDAVDERSARVGLKEDEDEGSDGAMSEEDEDEAESSDDEMSFTS